MPEMSCSTCACWQRTGDDVGECRRYAPQPVAAPRSETADVVTQWPVTTATDWCRQYQPPPLEQSTQVLVPPTRKE